MKPSDCASAESRVEYVRLSPDCCFAAMQALTSCLDLDTCFAVKLQLDHMLTSTRRQGLHDVVFGLMTEMQRMVVLVHLKALVSTDLRVLAKRVISDIDDTVFPSFKDFRGFAAGLPYPGVRSFLGALSPHSVTFVTARPPFLMSATRTELAKIGFEASLVLMGTHTSAVSGNLLAQKLKQVREMKRLWPECELVLVGDNGQRDIDLGVILQQEGLVSQVFIHDIYLDAQAQAPPKLDETGVLRRSSTRLGFRQQDGILMFSSYPMAALLAKQCGLITSHQLQAICRDCVREFTGSGGNRRLRLREDLLKDFSQVVLELDHSEQGEFWEWIHHHL